MTRKYEFRDAEERVPLETIVQTTFPTLLQVFQVHLQTIQLFALSSLWLPGIPCCLSCTLSSTSLVAVMPASAPALQCVCLEVSVSYRFVAIKDGCWLSLLVSQVA